MEGYSVINFINKIDHN